MTSSASVTAGSTEPPLAERAIAPFKRFAALEAAGGIVLLACTALALVWANSPWAASYHHLWELEIGLVAGPLDVRSTLHHFINDGLMAVFFFLVGLEIKREMLAGELASLRQSALPIAGAVGGMVVPAAVYAAFNAGGPGSAGWAVPMATDIAFALGVLALLGERVPLGLKVFLTALAIVDDIGAILVIALFYSGGISGLHLALAGGLLLLALGANASGVRRPGAYAAIGVLLWAAVLGAGIHATVAGVLLAMTIPARTRIQRDEFLDRAQGSLQNLAASRPSDKSGLADSSQKAAVHELERLAEQAQAPLTRLEHGLHGVVAFGIMPLFALANAGVSLQGGDVAAALGNRVTIGVVAGLLLGKSLGITLLAWLVVRAGVAALPAGATWRSLHGVSWLGGIGFTMALFIANLAFAGRPELLEAAKLGILGASLLAGITGWLLLRHSVRL